MSKPANLCWCGTSSLLPLTSLHIRASQHLDFGNFTVENLLTCVSEDIAFTVDLEHMIREVNGQVEQRTLRASQGYRVEGDRWRVIFRHGDPMAEPTDPTQPPAKWPIRCLARKCRPVTVRGPRALVPR